jgi:uncharacterized membrane protein YcaP (DUF421 family)
MFSLTGPWWEIVARAAIVYAELLLLIRITGKREVGELTPFDLVFLLVISEQVSPALTGGDESLPAAGIGLATLMGLNLGITYLTARIPRAERVLEGRPRFLIRRGRVDYETMHGEAVSKNELLAALRENGCFRPSEAEWAVLETNGSISVKPRER